MTLVGVRNNLSDFRRRWKAGTSLDEVRTNAVI